jgi:anti-anti-sigma factor
VIGLDVERRENVPVARARADIDAANARRVGDELADYVGADVHSLVLDLGDTRYVDSAGIDMLFRLGERLRQRRAQLLLVIPPGSHLERLAEIVGLSRALAVHASVDDALAAAAANRP